MARGTTLAELVTRLRAEAGHSLDPALGKNVLETFKLLLARHQEDLWDAHDWPHLRVQRDIALSAGQRLYDFPTDLRFDRIASTQVKWSGIWRGLDRGVGARQYNIHDSELDERSDPARCWDVRDTGSGEQLEIWPVPGSNADAATGDGTVRLTGTRSLGPLVANADVCEIDDRLIVLYAAAELLSKDTARAQLKLRQAGAILDRLKAAAADVTPFRLGPGAQPVEPRRLRGK